MSVKEAITMVKIMISWYSKVNFTNDVLLEANEAKEELSAET
jgi:hypothetical protein